MIRVLLVDNHDSFTYNIAHLVATVTGTMPDVVLNDAEPMPDLSHYTHLIIGPGPGTPANESDAGHSRTLYRVALENGIPVLGVCLGMQLMAVEHDGRVSHAPEPMHGRENLITLTPAAHSDPVISALPATFTAVRYHSLAVTEPGPQLRVLAHAPDGTPHILRHPEHLAWGVQFHPESIRSEAGTDLLRAFLTQQPRPTHTIHASDPLPLTVDPAVLYAHLYAGSPHAMWLDSASEDARSRFSYMGEAEHSYEHRVGEAAVPLMQWLREHLARFRLDDAGRAIAHECGGFGLGYAGYIGYGIGEETLGVTGLRSRRPSEPDAVLHFLSRALVIDHTTHTVRALSLERAQWLHGVDGAQWRHDGDGAQWVHDVAAQIAALTPSAGEKTLPPATVSDAEIEHRVQFRHSRSRYLELIAQCQEHIREGESYELCLTNEGTIAGHLDPLAVYTRLRRLARVPYGAYLRCGELSVASASPERFLEVTMEGEVESRPIKGTRARVGGEADAAVVNELRESEKDRAENLMIVDLVRNDLSRVCAPGSVHVPSIFAVESFPTVHQLISTVRGSLVPGATAVDVLEATFPGGSMTGAPKLRTVELLARMEAGERGVYSGSIGWISLSGALSLSIVIRTAVLDAEGARFGVGGAITRLSDPKEEYREMITKARTVVSAVTEPVRENV